MTAEALFYEWIAAECHLTRRVSASVDCLWRAFHAFAVKRNGKVRRSEWEALLRRNFDAAQGLAEGVCLQMDAVAFHRAYDPAPTPTVVARRRVKVNFLEREAA